MRTTVPGRSVGRTIGGFTLIELMIVVVVIAILAAIAIPNALAARVRANETSAIATLRNIWTSQAQLQRRAKLDLDGDGAGEYGFLREMTSRVGIRSVADGSVVGPTLSPSVLSAAFGQLTVSGAASRSGYYFQVYLPSAAGEGVRETPTDAFTGAVDPELSETFVAIYAWPTSYASTGSRTFFINQAGDMTFTDDEGYSGGNMYVNGAPGIAFQAGGSLFSITGRVAQGTVARDGNLWKPVQ